ncbi:stalk domain-containing protein [Desulfoscipio gibsoniae]|uniref:Sulfite oxidase-like oxidoreductase n=1 Tax=Desulfoscipio gibsoniae DSM 7213 TaxID=767817 RepID=R4KH67_9FIRM|nr:stalk domain-containing protein [Desulfoscipio gibsoniae]AGK99884.1 sulfite oxidase-like oxidoreductase [Desulfoscipio gibsoniae DSM 7213]
MQIVKTRWLHRFFMMVLAVMLFSLSSPAATTAAPDSLEIAGDGVTTPATFTLDQLAAMPQHQYVYSAINTWPTKKWYVGKGVELGYLLAEVGLKEEANLIRFTSNDGYTVTLTVKELLKDKRYLFPNFKAGNDNDGHTPGSPAGAVEVEAIISLIGAEGSDNPKYMNDMNSPMLMLGQRAVTEQTGNLFVKYLTKIEVLTAEPGKWDNPQANPGSGSVPAGTMVTLSNAHSDDDKIYYTTDDSTPTLESPIYNWIAKRWWPARADVLGTINHPIGPINKNTTIKAITIGPGKLDSDVVTFNYHVAGTEPAEGDGTPRDDQKPADNEDKIPGKPSLKVIKLTIGGMEAVADGGTYTLDAAPYVDSRAGRTLVPVRFVSEALGAGVDWDPDTGRVTIIDGDKEIILTLGSGKVQINGVEQTIDCAPSTAPPGRTFIPLRFVSETLGALVDYEAETNGVTITR